MAHVYLQPHHLYLVVKGTGYSVVVDMQISVSTQYNIPIYLRNNFQKFMLTVYCCFFFLPFSLLSPSSLLNLGPIVVI